MNGLRLGLLSSVALVTATLAPHAFAAAPTATATDAPASVDEVVVTARKRAESLADVPMSVSVVTGAQLSAQGVKSTQDLYAKVPGLYFTNAGGAAPTSDFVYLAFRGVGANGGQEPAAGVFIDGMYQPQLGFDIGFLDLDRLEVLRGPQGTLFGRNTEGGAVNLVTRKPGDIFTGRFEGEVADFSTWRLFGSVSGPLGNGFSAGLTAESYDTDGFTHNPYNDKPESPLHRDSIRGALRYNPNSDLDIVLSADRTYSRGNEIGFGAPLNCHCYDVFADNDQVDTKETEGVQLNVDWKLASNITLTSITGWRKVDSDIGFDFDGVADGQQTITGNGVAGSTVAPGPVTFGGMFQRVRVDQDFKSQELRLAGTSGKLDWLIGGYVFKQTQRQQRQFDIGPGVPNDPGISFLIPTYIREDFTAERKGEAVFGQASFRPIDRVELTGGLRWSNEDVSIGGQRVRDIIQIENASPTFFTLDGSDSFSNLSWMGSAKFDLTSTIKPYVTVAKGWKAGGFNRFPSTAAAALPYDSENSINYEAGIKGSFLDNHVTANLSVYHIDITGQQLLTVTPDASGIPVTTIANAGKSKSDGFEGELFIRPVDGLNIDASVGYTRARYTTFLQCAAAGVCIDRAGDPFEYTPQWTGSVSVDYTHALTAEWDWNLWADWRYVDGYVVPNGSFLADLGAEVPVPSSSRFDARFSVMHDRLKLTVYVQNVFDSYDYSNVSAAPFFPTTNDQLFVTPMAPRTVGAMVSYRF
jgi:iron complex outermembrane receptor protein